MKGLREILGVLKIQMEDVHPDIDLDTSLPDKYDNSEGLSHLIAWSGGDSIAVYAEIGIGEIHSVIQFGAGSSVTPYCKGMDAHHGVLEGRDLATYFLRNGHFRD